MEYSIPYFVDGVLRSTVVYDTETMLRTETRHDTGDVYVREQDDNERAGSTYIAFDADRRANLALLLDPARIKARLAELRELFANAQVKAYRAGDDDMALTVVQQNRLWRLILDHLEASAHDLAFVARLASADHLPELLDTIDDTEGAQP